MMTLTGKTGTSLRGVLSLSRIAWDGPHEGAMEITGFQELRVKSTRSVVSGALGWNSQHNFCHILWVKTCHKMS